MFVDYVSPFATWSDSAIKHNSCLSTMGNDGSVCTVCENNILSEIEYALAPESSMVTRLDSVSFSNPSVTWSDFVVRMDNNGFLK